MNTTPETTTYVGEWDEDVPATNGTPVWMFTTEYGDRAEEFYAEVIGNGPFTWTVGECFEGGRVLDTGEAATREQAQHDAEQAFAGAVNQ